MAWPPHPAATCGRRSRVSAMRRRLVLLASVAAVATMSLTACSGKADTRAATPKPADVLATAKQKFDRPQGVTDRPSGTHGPPQAEGGPAADGTGIIDPTTPK